MKYKMKQFMRLVAMGMILVVFTSIIVMILPEEYVNSSTRSASSYKIDFKSFNINTESSKAIKRMKETLGSIVKPLDLEGLGAETAYTDPISNIEIAGVNDKTKAYYEAVTGLRGLALKEGLNDIIDQHKELSYKEVWDALKDIDEDPSAPNNVVLIYTGKSVPKTSNGTGKDDWNREHVWAKSHGDFGTKKGAGTDLHHIKPADVTVNSSRNNKNFDFSENPHHEASGSRHDSDSFEPRDAVKGDVARMIFYMAVRYEGENGEPDLELVDYMNESKSPFHGKLSTLLEWHKMDPVNDFERRRNKLIYEKYQGNRNPFIDHPEWVDLIWDEAS